MIKQLENPKFDNYLNLKKLIFSNNFHWLYGSHFSKDSERLGYEDVAFYSHCVLETPFANKFKYPSVSSEHCENVADVLISILNFNKIEINSFLRINVNCSQPQEKVISTVPHIDHNFPHTNIIVYLTNAGGSTVVENEEFNPKEDDVIIFQGMHYMKTPLKDRRIILVATFI